MNITIEPVPIEAKSVLRNLLELYQYDFSEISGADLNETGCFGYRYLDHYWTDEGRHAFFIRADNKLAGFVMMREISAGLNYMAELFVLRKYRGKGVARAVAHRIFETFPGSWRVTQEDYNTAGQAFWRKIISEYSGGDFKETTMQVGEGLNVVTQEFETKGQPKPQVM